jgi:hypothetical protein
VNNFCYLRFAPGKSDPAKWEKFAKVNQFGKEDMRLRGKKMLLVEGFVVCNRKWGLRGFGPQSLGGFGRFPTQFGDERKMNSHRIFSGVRALALLAVVAGGLLTLAACNPQAMKPPPLPVSPSVVFTQDGMAFYVKGLRIPGTRQELRLREGGFPAPSGTPIARRSSP